MTRLIELKQRLKPALPLAVSLCLVVSCSRPRSAVNPPTTWRFQHLEFARSRDTDAVVRYAREGTAYCYITSKLEPGCFLTISQTTRLPESPNIQAKVETLHHEGLLSKLVVDGFDFDIGQLSWQSWVGRPTLMSAPTKLPGKTSTWAITLVDGLATVVNLVENKGGAGDTELRSILKSIKRCKGDSEVQREELKVVKNYTAEVPTDWGRVVGGKDNLIIDSVDRWAATVTARPMPAKGLKNPQAYLMNLARTKSVSEGKRLHMRPRPPEANSDGSVSVLLVAGARSIEGSWRQSGPDLLKVVGMYYSADKSSIASFEAFRKSFRRLSESS